MSILHVFARNLYYKIDYMYVFILCLGNNVQFSKNNLEKERKFIVFFPGWSEPNFLPIPQGSNPDKKFLCHCSTTPYTYLLVLQKDQRMFVHMFVNN